MKFGGCVINYVRVINGPAFTSDIEHRVFHHPIEQTSSIVLFRQVGSSAKMTNQCNELTESM